ncbi:MAG: hypothetical protein AAF960_12315 [Bacteroidota bacterium]
MTSDNLLKFLGNREYLHQVSYQELKSMVVQYPYSLSLRYLLAMKSRQEDNTDVDRNIELLATYGIDRAHLFKIFREEPIVLEDLEESVFLGEDFLELKALSELERIPVEPPSVTSQNQLVFIEPSTTNDKEEKLVEEVEISPLEIPSIPSTENEVLTNEDATINEEMGHQSSIPSEETTTINPFLEEIIAPKEKDIPREEETIVGVANSGNELVPSESFIQDDFEFNEDGLPEDAVDVSDGFLPDEDDLTEDENSLSALFKDAEEESMAEEAVSDSYRYIEYPETVLEAESQELLQESAEPPVHEEAPTEETNKEEVETTFEPAPSIEIPFEVVHSEDDPVLPEPSDIDPYRNSSPLAEVPETVNNEENELTESVTNVESLEASPTPIPQNKTITAKPNFSFDSLDRFEKAVKKGTIYPFKSPTPKRGFSSWQEQFSGVEQFSGLNFPPLVMNPAKQKTIKRKRKVVRKKYEQTVALAEESLKITEGIASETLAKLLVQQGQYSQAREMYQELCLLIPQKSSFFAAEIEKIQNLPDEDS